MIDKKSLNDAYGPAEALANKGVVLAATDTSALSHIIGDMHLVPDVEFETLEACGQLIHKAAQNEDHDETMGIIADLAAKSVLNTHRLVVDRINPHVRELVKAIESKLDSPDLKTNNVPVAVEYMTMPTVLELNTFQDAVKKIAEMDLYQVDRVSVGHYTVDEILDLVKFSSVDDFDDNIASYLQDNPGEVEIINGVLEGRLRIDSDVAPLKATTLSVLVLLSQSLAHTDQIKEGINASLAVYKSNLFHISILAARHLVDLIKSWDYLIATKNIYKTGENVPNKITLVQPVVLNMFKNGVSVEHLIGNHLLGRPYGYADFTVGDQEKIDKVLSDTAKEYDRVTRQNQQEIDKVRYDTQIRVALTTIRDDAIERAEDPEFLAIAGDDASSLVARANSACESVFKSGKRLEADQLGEFVAGLVISIYYAHTDALVYMDTLAEYERQYPEMHVVDLAKMARAALVVNWVCKQLAQS